MNLRNITLGSEFETRDSDYIIPTLSRQYTPVCTLKRLNYTYYRETHIDKYHITKNKDIKDSTVKINSSIINDNILYCKSKREVFDKILYFLTDYEEYMLSSERYEVPSRYLNYLHQNRIINLFINDNNISRNSYSIVSNISNKFIINKGTILLIKNNKVIPIFMLMIKNQYIHDFKVANTLDLDIDNSQFEFWINKDLEKLLEEKEYRLFTKLINSIKDNDIKCIVKSGITELSNQIFLPKLSTISDRIEWLDSVKKEYLNYSIGTDYPVKEYDIIVPKIEDCDMKFKSRNLNNLIKGNNKSIPKQKKINKFQLV